MEGSFDKFWEDDRIQCGTDWRASQCIPDRPEDSLEMERGLGIVAGICAEAVVT